jgi:hypothetical protein
MRTTALLLLCTVACATNGDRLDPYDVTSTGSEPDSDATGSPEEEDPAGDDSNGDGDGDAPLFDVGTGMGEAGDEEHVGCRGIDFLFVVDNSGSMLDEQVSLVTSFPGFVSKIEDTLEEDAKDFHVMVVDTDDGFGFHPDPQPGSCEAELGAGIVTDSTLYPCGFPDGRRYVTNADASLPGAFGCAAYVGTGGDPGERPAEAMGRALGEMSEPGACNDGFVREDSILVVTIITDEEDTDSAGAPVDWIQPLLDAKAGDLDSVVMLGLFDDQDLPNPLCVNGLAQKAPLLAEFVGMFGDRALRGSVCADSYDGFFADAVDIIDQACSDFEPPG